MNKNTVIRQDVKTLRRIRLNASTSPRLHEKKQTMRIRPLIILMALLLTVAVLPAQPLTLDSCKALALRNNAEIKNATLDVLVARQVRQQVLTKYFPNVSALAGGYYALNPLVEFGIDDINNAEARQWLHNMYAEYGAALGLPNSLSMCEKGYAVGATALQPVFMGGQIVNGNRLAKLGVQAAELQQNLTRDKLLRQVEENYWLVISLQDKRQTVEQALIFLDTLQRDVTAAFNAGLVTQNDQLKVTLKQHEMKSNMLKLNNGIMLASMALCQLVGVDYTDNMQFTDTLGDDIYYNSPFIKEDILDTYTWQYNSGNNLNVKGEPNPFLTEAAVNSRYESALLNLNVQAEKLKKKMLIGETLPHLTIGFGGSYGRLIFERSSFNGLAFALLQVPLTNWWETAHKIKQQNLIIQKAENDKMDLTQKMMLENRQIWDNLEEAFNQVKLMKITVEDAKANLRTSTINYQAGLIPVSELLEAQTIYRQAQDQLVEAKISYQTALSRYRMLTMAD